MTLREEAMALISLLPNSQKYGEKLAALLAAIEKADGSVAAAAANLKNVERSTAETAEKLEAQESLLTLLQTETNEIQARNAEAEAKLKAREDAVAQGERQLAENKQRHEADVKSAQQAHAARDAAHEASVAAQAEAHNTRAARLQGERDRLSARHRDLRTAIGEARRQLAAV